MRTARPMCVNHGNVAAGRHTQAFFAWWCFIATPPCATLKRLLLGGAPHINGNRPCGARTLAPRQIVERTLNVAAIRRAQTPIAGVTSLGARTSRPQSGDTPERGVVSPPSVICLRVFRTLSMEGCHAQTSFLCACIPHLSHVSGRGGTNPI